MEASPVTARVTFSDVNGPKGGADIRCGLLVSLPGQPPIRAERAQTTVRLAFDGSYARLVRQLEHARARRQDVSRRPKKYFAAKRLL
jgi:ribosome-associated translation inhibitor RaiA